MTNPPRYWFITYNIRKVTPTGAQERVANESIEGHPVDWIYKMNRDSAEYFTLLNALPICEERYKLTQKDCMRKGTRSIPRPTNNSRPMW